MSKIRQCYSGIGGQAVLEGIMMKNKDEYSVAVRKPDGQIAVTKAEYKGILGDSKIMKIPFLRGFFVFLDSMILGTKSLNYSASFYDDETSDQKTEKNDNQKEKEDKAQAEETDAAGPKKEDAAEAKKKDSVKEKEKSNTSGGMMAVFTTIIAVVIAVAVFVVLPYYLSMIFKIWVRNDSVLALIEGVLRVVIFITYVGAISMMKDIKRVYMYHGAEHKCINCIEKGKPLTVENVMKSSKQHKRCGTSFMLYVMLISVVLFFFIRVDVVAIKVLLRIVLIPVIAGISYELIRLAGRYDGWFIRGLSAAGLALQGLTTKEPDEKMVEVAIAAVEAVFDWKEYQRITFGTDFSEAGEQ